MATNKLVQIFSSVSKQSITISNINEEEVMITTKFNDYENTGMSIKLTKDEVKDLASELNLLAKSERIVI
jgi:hypothetical protein